ncbi:MAG: PEP-CTERM sorting domain-containing protein [Verrucomicrobia bacterium]|nr:PEP-CTERM sorting domain-containing protein [Verrucomicrobiota bacterium]MCH8512013.1 PEP-CTERM sorting domain-containing protein [Kiritimatiellia bacterium]
MKQTFNIRPLLLVSSVILLMVSSVYAQTTYVTDGSGGWGDSTRWDPVGVPGENDAVTIQHATGVTADHEFGGSDGPGGAPTASFWTTGDINISTDQTLTHNAGGTFTFSGGDRGMGGSGVFLNAGTYRHESDGGRIDYDNLTIRNSGTFIGDHAGTASNRHFTVRNNAVFENTASGTFRAQNGVTRWENNGLWLNDGGTVETINGNFRVDVIAKSTGGTFNLAAGTWVALGDRIQDEFSGHVSGGGQLRWAGATATNDVTFNVTGEGLQVTGHIETGGNLVTNDGLMHRTVSGDTFVNGSGEFNNAGTYIHGTTNRFDFRSAATVRNTGTMEYAATGNTGTNNFLTMRTSGSAFINEGHFIKSEGTGTARVENASGTFSNTGTLEVRSGRFFIDNTPLVERDDNTLTGGTWIATGNGIVDMRAGADGWLQTIGGNARVVMAGNGVIQTGPTNLSDSLHTVQGTLALQEEKSFTVNGNLNTPGTLEFGLGTYSDQGSGFDNRTLLTIDGDADFSDGQVFIEDLGLTLGTYRLVEWTGTRIGELTLANDTVNGYTLSLNTVDTTSGYVDLTVIPEPGTLILMIVALGSLALFRRRR